MFMRIIKSLASLRLTVLCLALGLILVFGGTLAQVHLGLYEVQALYFRSLIIFWTPEGAHWKIPVFPGGWLIGGVLLINLIAGHVTRFKVSRKTRRKSCEIKRSLFSGASLFSSAARLASGRGVRQTRRNGRCWPLADHASRVSRIRACGAKAVSAV